MMIIPLNASAAHVAVPRLLTLLKMAFGTYQVEWYTIYKLLQEKGLRSHGNTLKKCGGGAVRKPGLPKVRVGRSRKSQMLSV